VIKKKKHENFAKADNLPSPKRGWGFSEVTGGRALSFRDL
jgi:hypothetical protein